MIKSKPKPKSKSIVPSISPTCPQVQEVCLRYGVDGYYSSGKGDIAVWSDARGRFVWLKWYHDRFVHHSTTKSLAGETYYPLDLGAGHP